jgi:hypothetical protein
LELEFPSTNFIEGLGINNLKADIITQNETVNDSVTIQVDKYIIKIYTSLYEFFGKTQLTINKIKNPYL